MQALSECGTFCPRGEYLRQRLPRLFGLCRHCLLPRLRRTPTQTTVTAMMKPLRPRRAPGPTAAPWAAQSQTWRPRRRARGAAGARPARGWVVPRSRSWPVVERHSTTSADERHRARARPRPTRMLARTLPLPLAACSRVSPRCAPRAAQCGTPARRLAAGAGHASCTRRVRACR